MGMAEVFILLGGLALFLYGMQMMSNGLEAAAGNKMKKILERVTSNRIVGVVVGAAITAVIQSSSATTVMVVGFVNSGLMTLNQAVWVIMGANIGTTITGQLIALDIGAIAPLIAFIGVASITFIKNERVKHISEILAGLGILFIGMETMGNAMAPLQESETFIGFMANASNPLVGIIVGAIFTAVIQSSSASVGILQALAQTGVVPLSSAVYILFGQNIGTCITAVLASIGTKTNAKRTTVIHLMFNIIGSVLFTVICLLTPFVHLVETLTPGDTVAQIANVHTIFNITTTLLLLPVGTYMAKLAVKILPESKEDDEEEHRLAYIEKFESSYAVGNAALAISQVEGEVNRMLTMVKKNTETGFNALLHRDKIDEAKMLDREEYIDYLNKEISKYIVGLMGTEMADEDLRRINAYYKIISNIERVGDHAMNFLGYAKDLKQREMKLSESALKEVEEMKALCAKALEDITVADISKAEKILEKAAQNEQRIDDMKEIYLKEQIERMKKGNCKAETGIIFSEILTDFERIGDHILNIGEQYNEMM